MSGLCPLTDGSGGGGTLDDTSPCCTGWILHELAQFGGQSSLLLSSKVQYYNESEGRNVKMYVTHLKSSLNNVCGWTEDVQY